MVILCCLSMCCKTSWSVSDALSHSWCILLDILIDLTSSRALNRCCVRGISMHFHTHQVLVVIIHNQIQAGVQHSMTAVSLWWQSHCVLSTHVKKEWDSFYCLLSYPPAVWTDSWRTLVSVLSCSAGRCGEESGWRCISLPPIQQPTGQKHFQTWGQTLGSPWREQQREGHMSVQWECSKGGQSCVVCYINKYQWMEEKWKTTYFVGVNAVDLP